MAEISGAASMGFALRGSPATGLSTHSPLGQPWIIQAILTIHPTTHPVSGAPMQSGHFASCRKERSTSITSALICRGCLSMAKDRAESKERQLGHGCGAPPNAGTTTTSLPISGAGLGLMMTFEHGPFPQRQAIGS